jgi:hypothetical protein
MKPLAPTGETHCSGLFHSSHVKKVSSEPSIHKNYPAEVLS